MKYWVLLARRTSNSYCYKSDECCVRSATCKMIFLFAVEILDGQRRRDASHYSSRIDVCGFTF